MKNRFSTIKAVFLSCLAIVILSPSGLAQTSFQHSYKQLDTTILSAKYSLFYKQDSMDIEFVRKESMLLLIGSSRSQFISENLYQCVVELKKINDQAHLSSWLSDPNNRPPVPGILYTVYKNYPIGKTTYIEHIPSSTYKYEENINSFNWDLKDEIDSLMGYLVQKATTSYGGRDWIAWFCPKIPYNEGPYKFGGLPGLILKIHDSKNHYSFKINSIEYQAEIIPIEIPIEDYIYTTREDFNKAKANFRNDIISRAKEAGLGSDAQQTAARNMEKKNNPIELR
jgi:GLPGLI family protein